MKNESEFGVGKVEGDEKRIEIDVGKMEGGEKRFKIAVQKPWFELPYLD